MGDLDAAQLAADLGIAQTNPEGWFSPNTYFFVAGDSDRDILVRAYRRQREMLATCWRQRSADLPYADPYQALILASLVERKPAWRPSAPRSPACSCAGCGSACPCKPIRR